MLMAHVRLMQEYRSCVVVVRHERMRRSAPTRASKRRGVSSSSSRRVGSPAAIPEVVVVFLSVAREKLVTTRSN
jgi:hypothetical protein